MPEWSNGAVSKTVELLVGSGGSNPPLSAEDEEKKLSSLLEQLFFFIFCKARRRRAGMCDRREQIPPKRGMADKVGGLVLPPSRPSPSEGLVASLREGSGPVFRQSFLHLLASLPFSFHNGSISCISLPLWNFFSAASLLWASWTALPPQSPSTTAAFPAILCRCGMAFPPHPCYGLPGRHCLPSPLPQRQQFPHFSAVAEWLFRRILAMGFLDGIVSPVPFHNGSISRDSLPLWNFFSAASLLWASWTALSLRAPSTTALITAFSCRCGKDRRAHLPKVIRILPDLARLRKVG